MRIKFKITSLSKAVHEFFNRYFKYSFVLIVTFTHLQLFAFSLTCVDQFDLNKNFKTYKVPGTQTELTVVTRGNTIHETPRKLYSDVISRFKNLPWPKSILVIHNESGLQFYGGLRGLSGANRISLYLNGESVKESRSARALNVHELAHVLAFEALFRELGYTEKLDLSEIVKSYNKHTKIEFLLEDMIMKAVEATRGKSKVNVDTMIEYTGFFQEMFSDVFTSLYFKNHDIIDESIGDLINVARKNNQKVPETFRERGVYNHDSSFMEGIRNAFSHAYVPVKNLWFKAHMNYLKLKYNILKNENIRLEARELRENYDKSMPEVLSDYNYLNPLRYKIGKEYYLHAIKNGKEELLIQIVLEAITKETLRISEANDSHFNGIFSGFRMLKSVDRVEVHIEEKIEEYGFFERP